MIKNNIENYKSKITKLDISNARANIHSVSSYVRKYLELNPELDFNQALEQLDNDFINVGNEYYKIIDRLSGSQIQSIAADYALKNEKFLKEQYQRLKNKQIKESTDQYYTFDIEKSAKILIKGVLCEIRKRLDCTKITSEEEYTYLKNSLKNLIPNLKQIQKNDNIEILGITKCFFDDYKILQRLNSNLSKQLHYLGLEDLHYNMGPTQKFPDDIGINGWLSKEELEKMPLEKLSALNIFWQNKYSKEQAHMAFGYFVLNQIYSLPKSKQEHIELNDTTIRNLLLKYSVLEKLSGKIYKMSIEGKENPYFVRNYSYEYNSLFRKLLPDFKNDLSVDLDQSINRFMAIKNSYSIKSNLLCGTLINLIDNKKIRNWGYINDSTDKKENSIQQSNNPNVLIGFDYPRFKQANMCTCFKRITF